MWWPWSPPGGLSPRARGNPSHRVSDAGFNGSIPAGAGEPISHKWTASHQGVYPRGRGGTVMLSAAVRSTKGLSPRARGNLPGRRVPPPHRGSIPAGAGEPRRRRSPPRRSRVYPRGRGGTRAASASICSDTGLSPRARGNHVGVQAQYARAGSIPAGAGEPSTPTRSPRVQGVYPRGRGGTPSRSLKSCGVRGLSPRARGNRDLDVARAHAGGSIPAGAGEPPRPTRPLAGTGVYPRGRGGTPSRGDSRRFFAGLSPRARGNPKSTIITAMAIGSIPAGAGEPPGH